MKIGEALEKIKNLKPSQYGDDMLIGWLSALDGQIWDELLSKYGMDAPATPYSRHMLAREMLVPFPYDQLYVTWLAAQIDMANAEYERYNNEMMLFNTQHQEYINYITRNYQPEEAVYVKGVRAF